MAIDVAAAAAEAELRAAYDLRRSNAAALFEGLLMATVSQLQPMEQDLMARYDILRRLELAIGGIDVCKGFTVRPFGSFLSNIYTPWGDLDVTLVPADALPLTRKKANRILRAVQNCLVRTGGAIRIQHLIHPRVPLLMFEDSYWRISCDISVSNTDAVFKSYVLGLIVGMDQRCRQLIFLVKCWAKAQCINDPKTGTLNSFALSLLAIFHLQTRDPPILPPLNAIVGPNDMHQTSVYDSHYLQQLKQFTDAGFGKQNTSSVAELFVSFFSQFSAAEELWSQGLAVCTFTGKWGNKTSTDPAWESRKYAMLVEDPFDLSENCARSVHQTSLQHICKAFRLTRELLSDKYAYWFMGKLKEMLFSWPQASPRPCFHPFKPGIEQLEAFLATRPDKQNKGKKKTPPNAGGIAIETTDKS